MKRTIVTSSFFCRLSQQKHAFSGWLHVFRRLKSILGIECVSSDSKRLQIVTIILWEMSAVNTVIGVMKYQNDGDAQRWIVSWLEHIVRGVGVVWWRKKIILIHIQLAYPSDVTALQIGRNFHYIGVQYRREYKRTSVPLYTTVKTTTTTDGLSGIHDGSSCRGVI